MSQHIWTAWIEMKAEHRFCTCIFWCIAENLTEQETRDKMRTLRSMKSPVKSQKLLVEAKKSPAVPAAGL